MTVSFFKEMPRLSLAPPRAYNPQKMLQWVSYFFQLYFISFILLPYPHQRCKETGVWEYCNINWLFSNFDPVQQILNIHKTYLRSVVVVVGFGTNSTHAGKNSEIYFPLCIFRLSEQSALLVNNISSVLFSFCFTFCAGASIVTLGSYFTN